MTRPTQKLCFDFIAGETMAVSHEPPAYAGSLDPRLFRFETHVTGGAGWVAIAFRIFRTILTRTPDVVVSNEYRRAFLVNLALILTRSRAPHLVLGMNLSARPIVSRHAVIQRLIDRIFARSSAIVVHSTKEAEFFTELHHLPVGRFCFGHWGFDLPLTDSDRFDSEAKPFVCMIGRNNRDLETFADAVQRAGIAGIAVVPGYMHLDPALEKGLKIYRDLPMADCISCIRNAAANVTLLRDGSRGAGHITVVTAMHLGIPQIYSKTEVLREYFPSDAFGTAVPIGDAAAVSEAILQVLKAHDAPDLDTSADARRAFARTWLSHDSGSRRIAAVFLAMLENRALALTDPEWDRWLAQNISAPQRAVAVS